MAERRAVPRRLGHRVRVRVELAHREDPVRVGRQLAAHLAPGGRVGDPVVLVEEARDRVARGVEVERVVRAVAQEDEAHQLGREHLGHPVGARPAALARAHLPPADVQELVRDVEGRLAVEDLARDRVGAVAGAALRREVLPGGFDRHARGSSTARPTRGSRGAWTGRRTGRPSRRGRTRAPR